MPCTGLTEEVGLVGERQSDACGAGHNECVRLMQLHREQVSAPLDRYPLQNARGMTSLHSTDPSEARTHEVLRLQSG